jgi:hypothetical protein
MHEVLPVSYFEVFFTLKMEAAGTSKTLVPICQTERHHRPENLKLHSVLKYFSVPKFRVEQPIFAKPLTFPPGK